jgi:hypothetical protein
MEKRGIVVGNPERNRSDRRPRHRWENNKRMDLRETGFGVWIGYIWLRIGTCGRLFRTR